ncbi:MAG: hypothetical protein PHX24_10810 [Acidithiobacillus sp.]|nr:hypothetical protein [Acidithiobacillus sp.]
MMETAWILLFAFWMYWALIREKMAYQDGPIGGFWASCLENVRTRGPIGKLQPELNAAAARYVASVYGHRAAGKVWRRCLASFVMGWVVTLYVFVLLLLAGAAHTVIELFFVAFALCFLSAVILWTVVLWKLKQSGVPLNPKKRALIEIERIRQSPLGPAIDAAVFEVRTPSIWWWPWPQERGRFFRNRLKLLAVCLPVAWAVVHFIQTHVAYSPYFYEHNPVISILLILSMAVEWMLFVSALVMWGDWQGGSKSSWETFPLYILIKDIADLTC